MRTMTVFFNIALLSCIMVLSSCSRHEFRFGKWSFTGWNGSWGNVKGSGVEKKDARSLEKFTGINVKGHFVVEVDGSQNTDVSVSGDDNVVSLVETVVKNGILYVSLEQSIDCEHDLKIILGNTALNFIETSGSSQVFVRDLSTESLEIQSSGMAEIKLDNVKLSNALTMESSGASEVVGSGSAREVNVDVSGASDITFRDLISERARIKLSGAGDISVHTSQELDARVSGAGTVTYYGKPKNIRMKTAGAGEVIQGDEHDHPKQKQD